MSNKRLNQSLEVGTRPRNKKGGPAGLAIKLLILVAVGAYLISLVFSRVERDMTTLCRSDNEYPQETAILLDTTDGFTAAQANLIRQQLGDLFENSVLDERFSFYALGSQVNSYYPRFSICNPGDGLDDPDLSLEARSAYQNWNEELLQRIGLEINDLIDSTADEYSPILEMVQYVSNQSRWLSAESGKRLVVISTLVHHTPEFSNYTDANNLATANEDYRSRIQAFLDGVEVTLWYIRLPRALVVQNRGHIEQFWRPYINAAGGSIVGLENIEL